ncbi:MAG: helix-turn-helix transcriptional regulator [Candidatus Gastranaerophilales bacterium]
MCNNEFKKELGNKIKNLRISKSMTQEELYFKSTVSRSHIGMLEKGSRDVSLSALFKISRAFEINLSELLNFDDLEKYTFEIIDLS